MSFESTKLNQGGVKLDRCISPASFSTPDFLEESAWLGHSPFAFWLVTALKPRTVVELGTHKGFSYFVLCQAVRSAQSDTRCFAVDTWSGDEHSGLYAEDVFQRVSAHNKICYADFSELLRSSFDDALENVENGSVDLLHIDGRHHYEDVRHDYESWKPKLSDRAVVLFHDTMVCSRGFGVFRFWDEISRTLPSFEFHHGHGLGVLGFGEHLSEEMEAFFKVADHPELATDVRRIYSSLGQRWEREQSLKEAVQSAELSISKEKELHARIRMLENRMSSLLRSTSWRLTGPLRRLSVGLKRFRSNARRSHEEDGSPRK